MTRSVGEGLPASVGSLMRREFYSALPVLRPTSTLCIRLFAEFVTQVLTVLPLRSAADGPLRHDGACAAAAIMLSARRARLPGRNAGTGPGPARLPADIAVRLAMTVDARLAM